MALTASKLRQDIYRLLDRVLDTGVPLVVERRGRRLKIVPVDGPSKLDNLVDRPEVIVGNPDDIVSIDWLSEWRTVHDELDALP